MQSAADAFKKMIDASPETAAEMIRMMTHQPKITEKNLSPSDLGKKLSTVLHKRESENHSSKEICLDILNASSFWQDEDTIYVISGLESQSDLNRKLQLMEYLFGYLAKEIQLSEIETGQSALKEAKRVEMILVNLSGTAMPERI